MSGLKAQIKSVFLLIIVFSTGWLLSAAYAEKTALEASSPLPFSMLRPQEQASPQDWIKENQIHVTNSRIVIDLQNAEWASFTDTNSMDPVIDSTSHAIEIVPKKPSEIQAGDIASYKSAYATGTIIHRVIETGYDQDGWYALFKGDNLAQNDPGKVRFNQIKRVVVAIIY